MEEITLYRLEEIKKKNGKNNERTWIIFKNSVYDVTDYMKDHPGGPDLVEEYAGKDATRAFNDAGHSSDALKLLKGLKIGELHQEDRVNKDKKKVSAKIEEKIVSSDKKRTFLGTISCGLCG
ncbi:hypothetical protein WA026_009937 [Henosepilachna vigintioctopunctata]|uniref:Cytochrome b5 n=1 Tax=Henosepilachna vigintioctopunctata TaxID=420089 RepID=A0AAW1TTB1_9CUCU